MLKKYWPYLVALGAIFALAALGLLGLHSYRPYELEHADQRREIANYAYETGEEYFRDCVDVQRRVPLLTALACAVEAVSANRAAAESKYDLYAQQDMAKWAYALLLVSIAGMVISIAGLAAILFSLRQTWINITDNREIGQAQTRAYLAVSGGDFVIRKDGTIELNVEVRNFGQSPAKRGHVYAQLLIPRYRGGRIESDFDFSAPQSAEIFSISTTVPTVVSVEFKKPFPIDTVGMLRDTEGVLFVDVQVRWIDVFNGRNGPDEFRLQEELTGDPIFNNDLPRSRIGKMNVRTKQPSDET